MKQTFDVTGMTCAACSSRVEKTANAVPGVNAAVVNLLKNSMEVDYDGSPDTAAALCAAIDKAGYGASPRMPQGSAPAGGASGSMPGGGSGAPAGPAGAAAKEAKAVRTRLAVSFAFTIPLFYISMGHMFGWPLPAFLTDHANVMAFALTQFLLLLPVIFVNFRFFRVGFKALAHRSPNMDSLIALGSAASTVYGVYALYRIALALGAGDLTSAHVAAMDLYFESAAMILTLITLGKYFEARAKGKTTDAIAKLMDLLPRPPRGWSATWRKRCRRPLCVRATSWWCAPEKPCQWTGRCSTASAWSTSRSSRGRACRSRRGRAARSREPR